MAKKIVKQENQPWAIGKKVVKKKASESVKKTTSPEHQEVKGAKKPQEQQPKKQSKMDVKFLKISIPEHRRLKILAANKGMKLKEYTEWLVAKEFEEQDGGQAYFE